MQNALEILLYSLIKGKMLTIEEIKGIPPDSKMPRNPTLKAVVLEVVPVEHGQGRGKSKIFLRPWR